MNTAPCDHRRCSGGPCRSYAPADLIPTEEDVALANQLVVEGWMSISNNYRTIVRWLPGCEPPDGQVLLDMNLSARNLPRHVLLAMETHQANLYEFWKWKVQRGYLRSCCDDPTLTECRDLTLGQYKAFRTHGGHSA